MNKQIFLARLRARLQGLPRREVEERVNFYSEMIDDKVADGLSEREAVLELGSADEIAAEIKRESGAPKGFSEKEAGKIRLTPLVIILLILGSPIWLSLLIAAFSVIISLYAVLWSAVVSLWAVFASLAAAAVGSLMLCPLLLFTENALTGVASLGAALILAGLSILLFFGCAALTRLVLVLTKKSALAVKEKIFTRRFK